MMVVCKCTRKTVLRAVRDTELIKLSSIKKGLTISFGLYNSRREAIAAIVSRLHSYQVLRSWIEFFKSKTGCITIRLSKKNS